MPDIELLLAYYADDFTGATDVLEALSTRGVPTVLFVEPPDEDLLRRYPSVRAIGVAGASRTMSPEAMEQSLPGAFQALHQRGPKFVHYKVCSTFDSSPEIGSIGRAIDVGQRTFVNRFIPLVVGAPALERYCVFGNLFARSGLDSPPFRLDRHPTMCAHPVTPMTEADLREHLRAQTSRPIALFDVLALEKGHTAAAEALDRAAETNGSIVLFDVLSDAHLATIGRLICESQAREQKPLFVAGSSGVEYALTKHWQSIGLFAANEVASKNLLEPPQHVDRVVVVSGSCSPVTERQIGWALEHGFVDVRLDVADWCQSEPAADCVAEAASRIARALDLGRSVIARFSRIKSVVANPAQIGVILGRILLHVVAANVVRRVAVVGGDTAGQVARTLGIRALEFAGSLDPGAPLCIARSRDSAVDGLEITFKGGQVGYDAFFGTLLRGQSSRSRCGNTL